jgi:hypothetical protein
MWDQIENIYRSIQYFNTFFSYNTSSDNLPSSTFVLTNTDQTAGIQGNLLAVDPGATISTTGSWTNTYNGLVIFGLSSANQSGIFKNNDIIQFNSELSITGIRSRLNLNFPYKIDIVSVPILSTQQGLLISEEKNLFFNNKILNVGTNICQIPKPKNISCVKISKVKSTWEFGVLITNANEEFELSGQGWGIIDWGDGTVENSFLSIDVDQINNKHIYKSPGLYKVKLQGFMWVFFPSTSTQPSHKVISTSVIPPSMINTCRNTFRNCKNLSSIPRNIFSNSPNVTDFYRCFAGCTGLKSVPEDLFGVNLNANNFTDCFRDVTLNTLSYSNLLSNLSRTAYLRPNGDGGDDGPLVFNGGNSRYNLSGQAARNILIAKDWTIIDGGLDESILPRNTWDIWVESTTTNQTIGIEFLGLTPNITISSNSLIPPTNTYVSPGFLNLTFPNIGKHKIEISGRFFNFNPGVTEPIGNIRIGEIAGSPVKITSTSAIPIIPLLGDFTQTFLYTSFSSVSENLFVNYPNAKLFAGCFFSSQLENIPENLFANNSGAIDFTSCFSNNSKLSNIPENLFIKNTGVISFNFCFSICQDIISIPSGLFRNNLNVSGFRGCFDNCTDLTGVPANLFINNLHARNFSRCFANCSSLTSVPSGLFANNTGVTNFSGCFNNTPLITTSYSNLLINLAYNAAQRPNNVLFGANLCRYNSNAQSARDSLVAKGWVFDDLGLNILPAPTQLTATNIENRKITINWNAVVGATNYRIDIARDSGFTDYVSSNTLLPSTPTTYIAEGLTPGATFHIRIRAQNSESTSANSSVLVATTTIDPPFPPIQPTATNVTSTSFTANWNVVFSATSYRVDIARDSGFTNVVAANLPANTNSQLFSGLTSNTTYYVRVRAVNAGGTSSNSPTLVQATLSGIPSVPNTPTATNITQTSFTANWNSVADATSYRIDVSASPIFATNLFGYNNQTVNNTSISITGLTANTTYYVRVRAVNNNGTSASSNVLTRATLS